jgi:hypothetical protein
MDPSQHPGDAGVGHLLHHDGERDDRPEGCRRGSRAGAVLDAARRQWASLWADRAVPYC